MSKKLSVVIPMYNEEKIAADTVKTLDTYLSDIFPSRDYELVFVNDGSKDHTADTVRPLLSDTVRLAGYEQNRGKGCAVRTGVLAAQGDYILYTDCDLAYGTEIIETMYKTIVARGSDLVIGSRNISAEGYAGYTPLRRLMSKTYIALIRFLTGFHHSDSQCGFKCMTREAGHAIFSKCAIDGFAFDLEVLLLAEKGKFTVSELAVKIINHRESESKVSPIKDTFRMLRDVRRMKKLHKNTVITRE